MAMLMYLLLFKPFADNFFTRIEVMNETTNMLMLYLMLVFSDWVPDPEVRYIFGWIFIGVFGANLIVHLIFLLWELIKKTTHKLFTKCVIRRRQATKAPIMKPKEI